MSETKEKRKTHGAELKAKVGLEAVRGVKTINEIAQVYDVDGRAVEESDAMGVRRRGKPQR